MYFWIARATRNAMKNSFLLCCTFAFVSTCFSDALALSFIIRFDLFTCMKLKKKLHDSVLSIIVHFGFSSPFLFFFTFLLFFCFTPLSALDTQCIPNSISKIFCTHCVYNVVNCLAFYTRRSEVSLRFFFFFQRIILNHFVHIYCGIFATS